MQNQGSCHWLELADFLSASHRSGEDKEIWGNKLFNCYLCALTQCSVPSKKNKKQNKNNGCLPLHNISWHTEGKSSYNWNYIGYSGMKYVISINSEFSVRNIK